MNFEALLSPRARGAGGIGGRRVPGPADGMADTVPAVIDGQRPAALSSGEFVIDADVVAALGNGNTEAGIRVLEAFVARVRKAKTGSTERAPRIDPASMLPV